MRITELFRLSDVKAAWLDFAGLLRSFTGRSPQRRTPCDTRPPSQQPSLLIVLQTLALAVLLPIASEAAVPHTPVHAEGLSAPLFSPACSFYIAPAGDDTHTGASTTDPWRTFTHALAQLQPGDTLCLLDGIYTQPLDIRVSGTETQPLTIRALHDGQAVIDGEYLHAACQVKDSQNVILEGVICRRSAGDVVLVVNAQRIIIRRVSAYDVRATDCNCQAFGTNNAEDVLFEDAIAGGRARTSFTLYNSRRITVRRAYARWQEEPTSDSMGVNNLMQIYGTNESLAENNVGTLAGQTQNEVLGWGVWNHIYNTDPIASENTFIGNIAFDLTHAGFFDTTCRWQTRHNTFLNNASINNRFGMWQRGDDSQILTNFIHTGGEMGFFMRETSPDGECEPVDGFSLGSTLTGSVFLSVQGPVFNILQTNIPKTLTHETNLYWDNESIEMELSGSESDTVDPVFNTERWGYGAYLFPDPVSPRYSGGQDYAYLGADIRYRSEDGVETGEPLWPWPMEERICDELGVSVTWELSDQVSASTGERCAGGLWKTLDGVYEQQEQTFNDIPPGFWAYDEIEALYRAGYIAGCSAEPRLFCPDNTMTRAESAVFVERGLHGASFDPPDPEVVVFVDVALDAWYADWVDGLWLDGFTAGCSTDPLLYCPLAEHTRAEGSVFFLRLLMGKDYKPVLVEGLFADVLLEEWYAPWIEEAYRQGLLDPCLEEPEMRICPEEPLSRAEAAVIMARAQGLVTRIR